MKTLFLALTLAATSAAAQTTTTNTACERVWDWGSRSYVLQCSQVSTTHQPPAPKIIENPYFRGDGTAEDAAYSKEAEAMKPRHTDGRPMPCPAPWRWTESDGCQRR